MSYDKDYIEYEDGVLKRVRCMACGIVVAQADETPSVKYDDKTFVSMKRYPNYRTKRVTLVDGSCAELILCDAHAKEDVDVGDNGVKIGKQIVNGFIRQAKSVGLTTADEQKIKDKYKNLKAV